MVEGNEAPTTSLGMLVSAGPARDKAITKATLTATQITQSEVKALRDTFGDSTNHLVIANTKGFTGHPMGVGIEDASMYYGLLTGRIPPIANYREKDPELGELNLSKGGEYPGLNYGLRFGAGFGSQIALSLARKWDVTGERIDGSKFMAWIRQLAQSDDVVLRVLDGKLVSYVDGSDNLHGGIQGKAWNVTNEFEGLPINQPVVAEQVPEKTITEVQQVTEKVVVAPTVQQNSGGEDVVDAVIDVVVKHTGYPADFVELDQDLEGELGIDTVKQAEIMAEIRSRFGLPVDEDFVLSDYPTLNHMIGYIDQMSGGASVAVQAVVTPVVAAVEMVQDVVADVVEEVAQAKPKAMPVNDDDLVQTVIEVVVEHTGYPADFIELDQDLEGELGIDTVKQAEIMADIRSKFSLPVDEDFVLSDYPTLNHMIAYIHKMTGNTGKPATPSVPEEKADETLVPLDVDQTEVVSTPPSEMSGNADIQSKLIDVVVKHTGYPADFIEMDQDLEGELGIDTVKQAEIMAEVRDIFQLPVDEDFILGDHPTLNHFTAYIIKMQGGPIQEPPASQQIDTMDLPEQLEMPEQDKSSNASISSQSTVNPSGCRRWQVEVEECLGLDEPIELSGTVVVTDDGWGIAEELCTLLEARGLAAIRVGFESEIRDMSIQVEGTRTVLRADPANTEHIALVGEELNKSKISGVIHLAALKLAGVEWEEDTYPSSQISLAAHGWFSLLKQLGGQLATIDSGIVASVTTLDGRHGNKGELFNSIQCSASGVTKSYSFEQPHLRTRALDLHPEIVLDAVHAAEIIDNDLFAIGGDVEIGIDRDGRRWTLVAFDEQLESEREPLVKKDTWLVSGGGSKHQ